MWLRLAIIRDTMRAVHRENDFQAKSGRFRRAPVARQIVPDATDRALERRGLITITEGVGKEAAAPPAMMIALTREGRKVLDGEG